MAPSSLVSKNSPPTTPTNHSHDSHMQHKKKKKPQKHQNQHNQEQSHPKWNSQKHQHLYSSKLRQALTTLNLTGNLHRKQVREAADKVLAVTAKGRTRWSRTILTNRLKLKFRKKHNRERVVSSSTGSNRSKKQTRFSMLRFKTVQTFQRKVKVLGRLVPNQ
ncbi:unnamed protein product [Lupinus luteus]|uniref:Uncharacterized protein n=1 Tax=Lupinus luteus TaxID=3873 RepID=A0AAV1YLJ0_LUPLU